jgi:F420-non-reducing hydrogenase large subunit
MSVEKAAKGLIQGGEVSEGLLNMVEMAFRPYDPCHACATHALGKAPLIVELRSADGSLLKRIKRDNSTG